MSTPRDVADDARAKPATGLLGLAGRLLGAPLVAATFLTVIPVPVPRWVPRVPMGWGLACFPMVGAAMGGLLAGADGLMTPWFPPVVRGALLLALLLGMTGALHLDGLMDSFDGMFGGKDPAGRLAIMKDSRVGSFGVAAGMAVLLVEYSALASLAPSVRWGAIVAALALSRWAMVALLWGARPAATHGLAAMMKPEAGGGALLVATMLATGCGWWAAGWLGVASLGLAAAVAALVGWLAVARLGGITGDSCGAVGTLAEAAVLLAGVASLGKGF